MPVAAFVARLPCKQTNTHPVLYIAYGFRFYKGAPLKNRIRHNKAEKLVAHWLKGFITINKEDYIAAKKLKLRKNEKVFYGPGIAVDIKAIQERAILADKVKPRQSLGIGANDVVIITMTELLPRKNHEQVRGSSYTQRKEFSLPNSRNGKSEESSGEGSDR